MVRDYVLAVRSGRARPGWIGCCEKGVIGVKRYLLIFSMLLVVVLVAPSAAMATDPIYLNPWDAPDPVPANVPLVVPAGWIAVSRGLAMSAPTCNQFYFTIWNEQGDVVEICTLDDSKDFWVPGVVALTAEETGLMPFNPRIGAKQYVKDWRRPIENGLPPGHYSMTAGGVQTRMALDLDGYFEGQHSAMPLEPGEFVVYENWEFDVQ